MTAPGLTVRQALAIAELVEQARGYGVEIRHVGDFNLTYKDEVRPGRGHDVIVNYVDGEHVVIAYVDVYGNGDGASIGSVEWIHEASNDDCSCTTCERSEFL